MESHQLNKYVNNKIVVLGASGFIKVKRAIYRSLASVVGYFVVGILYLISWYKPVKAVELNAKRIGHLAYCTNVFLRQVYLRRLEGERVFYIGIATSKVANHQLLDMFRRKFFITRNLFPQLLLRSRAFTNSTRFFQRLSPTFNDEFFPYHTIQHDRPVLEFTAAEEEKGKQLLKTMGVDNGSWFVCFHARDPGYLSTYVPGNDWSYQDFRDCSVENYLEAAKYIARSGGAAIRMGHWVNDRLPTQRNHLIIDYASEYRTDFGDIYLPAKARFFLGNSAGLFNVSLLFGIPIALANYPDLEHLTHFSEGDLFIPKKIWSKERKRFLTFGEILCSGIGHYLRGDQFDNAGLEMVENTPQEILDLATEMNERLNGSFVCTEEDEELQGLFHKLFAPHHYCYGTPVQIGAQFLRENRELLN